MAQKSAGIILYRGESARIEVLLVHPGGPFWKNKDTGAWTFPKGEIAPGEEPLNTAIREFKEETGSSLAGTFLPLGEIKQAGGKIVWAWAIKGDFNPENLVSNKFSVEWPPKSGKMQEFPEIDRAAWFTIEESKTRILPSQIPFLDLLKKVSART